MYWHTTIFAIEEQLSSNTQFPYQPGHLYCNQTELCVSTFMCVRIKIDNTGSSSELYYVEV